MFERIARWFARFKPAAPSAERAEGYAGAEEPVKPTERVSIDCAEVLRLRAGGVSWRKISRLLPGTPAQSTIRYQFEQWLSRQQSKPEPTPEVKQVQAPILATQPVRPSQSPAKLSEAFRGALAGLGGPVAAVKSQAAIQVPEPEPEPDEELAPVAWWTELPDTRREFLQLRANAYETVFLVIGAQDAQMAWSCQQPAIGLPGEWMPGYEPHPVIAAAKRIYAVLRPQGPSTLYVLAALSRSAIRERVLVCTSGDAPLDVFRYRLGLQRQLPRDPEIVSALFEQTEKFKPLPEPSRVSDLLPKPEPPEPWAPFDGMSGYRL